MSEQWLEEFLYRGRPPNGSGADKEPAFHIVIGTQYDHPAKPGEKIREFSEALTMDQAKELGFDMAKIFEGFNVEAVVSAQTRGEQLVALEENYQTQKNRGDQLEQALSDASDRHKQEIAEISASAAADVARGKRQSQDKDARIAELEQQVAEINAAHRDLDAAHNDLSARVASATKVLAG